MRKSRYQGLAALAIGTTLGLTSCNGTLLGPAAAGGGAAILANNPTPEGMIANAVLGSVGQLLNLNSAAEKQIQAQREQAIQQQHLASAQQIIMVKLMDYQAKLQSRSIDLYTWIDFNKNGQIEPRERLPTLEVNLDSAGIVIDYISRYRGNVIATISDANTNVPLSTAEYKKSEDILQIIFPSGEPFHIGSETVHLKQSKQPGRYRIAIQEERTTTYNEVNITRKKR